MRVWGPLGSEAAHPDEIARTRLTSGVTSLAAAHAEDARHSSALYAGTVAGDLHSLAYSSGGPEEALEPQLRVVATATTVAAGGA